MKATDGVIIVRSHDIWKKTKSSLELKDWFQNLDSRETERRILIQANPKYNHNIITRPRDFCKTLQLLFSMDYSCQIWSLG